MVQHECDHLDGILYPQRMTDHAAPHLRRGRRSAIPIDLAACVQGAAVTDETARKDALVAAVLPDVPFDGWTRASLRAAAHRIRMDDAELAALFPSGPRDAVAWFSRWADRMTLETVASRPIDDLRTHERIALGLKTRLDLLLPHREAVRRGAVAPRAAGERAARGAAAVRDGRCAVVRGGRRDDRFQLLYEARDACRRSMAATTLYWLDDRSEGAAATEAFIDRRLADVGRLPRLGAEIGRIAGRLPNPLRFVRAARPRV